MYEFTDKMGEISGFGGGYEECCRKMLRTGLEWLDAHPNAEPKFHSYQNIYGVCIEDNEDAKALTKTIIDAAAPYGATGAMHQVVISSCLWIRSHGWPAYVESMSKPDNPEVGRDGPLCPRCGGNHGVLACPETGGEGI